jgi:Putative bacterial sensory transduction regulator
MVKTALIIAAALIAIPGVASAQMAQAKYPNSIVTALQEGGYKAILTKDSTGDPKIESASSGSRFFINFYGCTKNVDCKTVTFYAGWTGTNVSMNQANEWNKVKRFSRAYIDKDGDPALEFDVDLDDGGMSQALFIDNVEFWEASLANFKKHIGL